MVSASFNVKLLPDWTTPRELFLVWPGNIPNRKSLVPIYLNLINLVPNEICISIIIENKSEENKIQCLFNENEIIRAVTFVAIPPDNDKSYDIWIRDWAPVCGVEDSGKTSLVKAMYHPHYISSEESIPCDNAGKRLAVLTHNESWRFPLIWDLGNITHNGNGVAIISDRILKDNREFSRENINELFEIMLGITKLILIPEEPGDVTGHVDGLIRFVDEKVLVISKYPDICKKENRFIERIKTQICNELGEEYKIFGIPNGLFSDETVEGIPSAFGNHLNFLRLGNHIYLPVYGIDSDKNAKRIFEKILPDVKLIPVESSALSHKGGVLNCITWVTFLRMLNSRTLEVKLDDCKNCTYHMGIKPGHAICDHKLVYTERMTGINSDGLDVVLFCPLERLESNH